MPEASAPAAAPVGEVKPTCKICCACPETKTVRDECIVNNGEEACQDKIEAHKVCLRGMGFKV
jgi:cytochrome c oxidase assembly protein subunit 17